MIAPGASSMVIRAARIVAVLLLLCSVTSHAQIASGRTPPPDAVADNEPWYVGGAPLVLGGIVYYPTGPITHFSANEMVPGGMFEGVPIYRRTTQEPGSIIYVPLAGGLVRPYERRRSGALAGTVGSTVPHFPVILPAQEALGRTPSPPVPVEPVVPPAVATSGFALGTAPGPVSLAGTPEATGEPVGTRGAGVREAFPQTPPHPRLATARRPVGLNDVYVDFNGARWFADGRTVEPSGDRFTRAGEHEGFPVYRAAGEPDVIYIVHVAGSPNLLAPYRSR